MLRRSVFWVATLLLAVCLYSGPASAITVQTRFLAENPQLFPVGEIVDINAIQNNEDIDLGTLPALFEVTILPGPTEPLDTWVALQVRLETAGLVLVDYVSSNFTLGTWMNSSGGTGKYNNRQLDDLELGERPESHYGDMNTFLGLLDGSNLSGGVYILTFTVYSIEGNSHDGDLGAPLANGVSMQQIQVFNPTPPELQSPDEGEEVSSFPIHFSWDWNAGSIPISDIELIIVAGNPGEDGETVIASRNSANTMYAGAPQLMTSHTYTGFSGQERSLTPGQTYYWTVRFNINTVVPGRRRMYDSNIFSFVFAAENPGGAPSGGTTQGGNDPLLDQLSSILPNDVMQSLYNELQGYSYQSLMIDGVSGYTQQDLLSLLNNPSITIVTVGLEE